MERLRNNRVELLLDFIRDKAFEISPANPYTPQIVQAVSEIESILRGVLQIEGCSMYVGNFKNAKELHNWLKDALGFIQHIMGDQVPIINYTKIDGTHRSFNMNKAKAILNEVGGIHAME